MIAKLTGMLDSTGKGFAIIDVSGVGYLVTASARTLSQMGSAVQPVSLYIETVVREDQISLYGFQEVQEQKWFQLLTTVQGVGARAALAILSVLSPDQLPIAIASGDKTAFTQADGIGPKIATRILTELKDKAGDIALGQSAGKAAGAAIQNSSGVVSRKGSGADAVSALVNLGYGRSEAFGAVSVTIQQHGEDAEVDILIRESLKELSA